MMFADSFSRNANRIAIITDGDEVFSYAKIEEEVKNICAFIPYKSLIFCLSSLVPESIVGFLAALEGRHTVMLLDADVPEEIFRKLFVAYQPKYCWLPSNRSGLLKSNVITTYRGYSLMNGNESVNYKLHPELALLLSTSGSTGSPKVVRLTFDNLICNAKAIQKSLDITVDDRPIVYQPMHYAFGLSIITTHLLKGCTLLLTRKSPVDPNFWSFFSVQKATSFSGVPFIYEMLLKLDFFKMHLPYLRKLTQAGGRLSESSVRQYALYCLQTGKEFYVMYGQTEATARISCSPIGSANLKPASIGKAIDGGEIVLQSVDGDLIVEPEKVGELVYKGGNVSLGYAHTFSDLGKGDENGGVLHTGDLAKFDIDGYFYIVGRLSRDMKVNGVRINLDELENLLNASGTHYACLPSDEKIFLFITQNEDSKNVLRLLFQKTAIQPSSVLIRTISEIPLTLNGKVDYPKLRDLCD